MGPIGSRLPRLNSVVSAKPRQLFVVGSEVVSRKIGNFVADGLFRVCAGGAIAPKDGENLRATHRPPWYAALDLGNNPDLSNPGGKRLFGDQTMAEADLPPREAMDFDVVIVGAGPAGLSAAIRLKQLAAAAGRELGVFVVEKGSEVGAHILSGAVIDPIGLDRLIPDWKAKGAPVETAVSEDRFYYLGPAGVLRIPNFVMPPLMGNHGNYIVSLGNLCRWLGEQATEMGVEIYPGFAAAEVLYDDKGAVTGVATGDKGVGKNGEPTDRFQRGMELRGKYTIIAEGARGSLAKQLMAKFGLEQGRQPQKYGLGLKELWEVRPEMHRPGLVQHTLGWPLDNRTGGGSFLYHYGANLVSVGFVVHLNYAIPTCRPTPSSSASRPIRPFAAPSKAASASPTGPARSARAAGNRSRSSPSPAASSSAVPRAS